MYDVVSPLGIQYAPIRCAVRRHGNEHEIVRVRVPGLHNVASEPALAAGAPMTVRYGADVTNLYPFFGYVDHTEPHSLQTGDYTDIVCIGPTRICKTGSARTFTKRTIPGILGDVFNRWQLGFLSDTHLQQWATQEQTAGQSDWAFAISLVQQIGFTLVPQGAIIRLIDPVKVLSVAPPLLVQSLFSFEPIVAAQGSARSGSVYARHVVQGDGYAVGANPPTILGTFDGIDPQVQSNVALATVPPSLGEAQALANGAARNNVWVHQATLVMQGDARLRPGSVIDFEPPSAAYVSYRGLWAVIDVDHTLSGAKSFVSTLKLGRDSFGPVQVRPSGTPIPTSFGTQKRGVPGTIWRNNQWTAQWNLRSS